MRKKFGYRLIGASIFSIGITVGFSNLAISQHSPAHPTDKPGGKDVVKDEELDKKRHEEKEKSVQKYKEEGGKGVHRHNGEMESKEKQAYGISGRGDAEGGAGITGYEGSGTEKDKRVEEAQKEAAQKGEGK